MDKTEREIDLLHLALPIAMQWRKIIAAALIGLVLGVLFMACRLGGTNEQVEVQHYGFAPEESYQYKLDLYRKLKIDYESELKSYQEQLDKQKEYNNKSLLMQIDPLNKPVAIATLRFYTARDFQDIFQQYELSVADDVFWQGLVQQYGGEPKYFRELVSIRVGDGATVQNPEILLCVTMPEKVMADAVLSALVNIFDSKIVQVVQRRVYTELDVSAGFMDVTKQDKPQTLAQIQNMNHAVLIDAYQKIHLLYSYYNSLDEPKRKIAAVPANVITEKKMASDPRWAQKGALFGSLLACLALAGFYGLQLLFFPGRILSSEEFAGTYQLNCLMMLAPKPQRQHMLALDRLLLRWSDSPRFGKLTEAERWVMAAENIRVHVQEGEQILLLGTLAQAQLEKVREALSSQLAAQQLSCLRFAEQDVAALREINHYHHIVLVEELWRSVYKEVDNELQLLKERQKNILGCILV